MVEGKSQSRYGIMQELNERKVRERESLNKLETEMDDNTYKSERAIQLVKNEIEDRETTYVRKHKAWKKEQEIRKDILEKDLDREIKELENTIQKRDDTYEQNFQEWKAKKEDDVKRSEKNLERYNTTQKAKVKDQTEIIAEIEKGIESLKEISKDQKSD